MSDRQGKWTFESAVRKLPALRMVWIVYFYWQMLGQYKFYMDPTPHPLCETTKHTAGDGLVDEGRWMPTTCA